MRTLQITLSILVLTFLGAAKNASAQTIHPFAGNHTAGYSGDGAAATAAQCYGPIGIAVDNTGNVYFTDQGNSVVRKVNTAGIISTVAGNDTAGYSGDGGAATLAKLNQPSSIAVDDTGNIFIADDVNNVIRKVNTTGIISTYAGDGTAGFLGDAGLATNAKLNSPKGVAVDHFGNLYIADANNNVVRKVTTNGFIYPFAGTGAAGFFGNDSAAVTAKLHLPTGVAVDALGRILIVDQLNNVVRRVNPGTGIITAFAGTGLYGYTGDGNYADLAKLSTPTEVSTDASGNVYIADYSNHVVRKVTSAGIISTIAGNGTSGYSGDGGPAIAAQLAAPYDMAVSSTGKIYITDQVNNVVRVVYSSTGVNDPATATSGLHIFPNPSNGSCMVEIPESNDITTLTVMDMVGRLVQTRIVSGNTKCQLTDIQAGNYIIKVVAGERICREKFVVQ